MEGAAGVAFLVAMFAMWFTLTGSFFCSANSSFSC